MSLENIRTLLRATFLSLSHRNFRLYFFAQMVSLSGTWMQAVALSWLVYRTTHSPLMLAIVDGAQLLPILLFGLWGGSLADRFDRRKILFITQFLALLQASVLAFLTFQSLILPWHAVVLSFILGTLNAFEVPSRQSFIIQMVGREDLVNAISLNSTVFSLARSVGPALAGLLVAFIGEGGCFALNAVSYLAALAAILAMRISPQEASPQDSKPGTVREALGFAASNEDVRRVLLQGLVFSIFGLQYSVLMPIYAAEVLGGNVMTLGFLRASAGFGALLAALSLACRGGSQNLRLGLGLSAVTFGLSMFCFAFSKVLILSIVFVFLMGFAMTSLLSGGHSLVQLAVDERLRGRVMSIYMTVMLGIAPLGSFVFGVGAQRMGVLKTTCICAVICLIAGSLYLRSVSVSNCEKSAIDNNVA